MSNPSARQLCAIDWDGWGVALEQFSVATGITVSAYDTSGTRRVGPLMTSRIASVLNESPLWHETGEGTRLERRLSAACAESAEEITESFCNELCVHVLPIVRYGKVCGTVVYGWVFNTFATGLGCNRIAKLLDLPYARLWAAARMEVPVPAKRMATYTALLKTMITFNAQQAEAIDRLNELGRMREVFLASVSHEMRTPLSAISLRLQLLLLSKLDNPEAIRTALEAMAAHVEHEGKLIEDLIDAARTRTGQLHITPSAIRLLDVIGAAAATVEPKARVKKLQFTIQADDQAQAMVIWGDAQRLQQLLWNLLSNAIKFTPAGGAVSVTCQPGDDMHKIIIRDTGMGISPQDMASIFEAFSKQKTGNEQGLGLGLSIAQHIAELHGGLIDVSSPGLNQGACFTVSLPSYRE